MPPLRAKDDLLALRQALKEGHINALCSDHTPVDDDAKQLPFAEAEVGATGVELLLPLTLLWGEQMGLTLPQMLAPVTINPAKILGLSAGRIAVGAEADLCIFDPAAEYLVQADTLKSQGKNTPFLGTTLKGLVRYTLIKGEVAFENRSARNTP
jgi:dihydroorotase